MTEPQRGEREIPADEHPLAGTNRSQTFQPHEFLNPREIVRLHAPSFPSAALTGASAAGPRSRLWPPCLNLTAGRFPPFATIEIRAASSGAPEVFLHDEPAPIAISLSHSAGTALCTIAPLGINFGCDLEMIEPRTTPSSPTTSLPKSNRSSSSAPWITVPLFSGSPLEWERKRAQSIARQAFACDHERNVQLVHGCTALAGWGANSPSPCHEGWRPTAAHVMPPIRFHG